MYSSTRLVFANSAFLWRHHPRTCSMSLLAAKGDSYADVCTGCPPCLAGCVVDSAGPMECTPQLEHSESAGVGVILETLAIKGGYWRATNTSTTILPCYNEGACIGGITGSSGFCHQGYSGPCACTSSCKGLLEVEFHFSDNAFSLVLCCVL